MVMKKSIRTLRADEIECRVQKVTEKGCILLIYKDARVDMRILDIGDNRPKLLELGEQPAGTTYYRKIL